ncbi:hypothetical protein DFQ30_003228 [Apophysomyces sp. BC1015]|nr:hypothetical protein DFQ30_003228 [Apophysomyces sp. BC1015]
MGINLSRRKNKEPIAQLSSIQGLREDTSSSLMTSAELISTDLTDMTQVLTQREYHQQDSSSYWLPKDEEEQRRLTGQHCIIKEIFGGKNVLSSVTRIVPLSQGAKVLDIGSGSGAWIFDMASEYPESTFLGVDIVEIVQKNLMTDKTKFYYGDVLEGLDFEDNTFDLVNMRFFVLALRVEEWPIAIKEALRVTKPGGVIHLMEPEYKMPSDIVRCLGVRLYKKRSRQVSRKKRMES